jgi:hypothetical protein
LRWCSRSGERIDDPRTTVDLVLDFHVVSRATALQKHMMIARRNQRASPENGIVALRQVNHEQRIYVRNRFDVGRGGAI